MSYAELLYAPAIVDAATREECEKIIAAHGQGERGDGLLGLAIEGLAVTTRTVRHLQSPNYVNTLRDVIQAHLRTHANFPIEGSKRQEDMRAKKQRQDWRDCDCDLCHDGRRALTARSSW